MSRLDDPVAQVSVERDNVPAYGQHIELQVEPVSGGVLVQAEHQRSTDTAAVRWPHVQPFHLRGGRAPVSEGDATDRLADAVGNEDRPGRRVGRACVVALGSQRRGKIGMVCRHRVPELGFGRSDVLKDQLSSFSPPAGLSHVKDPSLAQHNVFLLDSPPLLDSPAWPSTHQSSAVAGRRPLRGLEASRSRPAHTAA